MEGGSSWMEGASSITQSSGVIPGSKDISCKSLRCNTPMPWKQAHAGELTNKGKHFRGRISINSQAHVETVQHSMHFAWCWCCRTHLGVDLVQTPDAHHKGQLGLWFHIETALLLCLTPQPNGVLLLRVATTQHPVSVLMLTEPLRQPSIAESVMHITHVQHIAGPRR